jgi:hypothetical protein
MEKLKPSLAMTTVLAACVLLATGGDAFAALPDNRGYELISPVARNGITPYAAVPSLEGGAVDFQARGAFSGATSGSLNLYQATRATDGWQTAPLTPTPTKPLGALEEQAPVWFSSDLRQTIFTTPESYVSVDNDQGALDLYMTDASEGPSWISQGTQGASASSHVTFDGATPDGSSAVFSTAAALLPTATGLGLGGFPEPEYLYRREIGSGQTRLLSLDQDDHPVGYAATTLATEYTPGHGEVSVVSVEGFFPGEFITIGEGSSAETTQIDHVHHAEESTEQLVIGKGSGLATPHPAGTPVTHLSEGSIFGDGGHLTSGLPPASEYLPADAGSGSTTDAISSDGSKIFFESPNPANDEPTALYMRQGNSTTVKIAGAAPDGTTIAGAFAEEASTFGSARYEAATMDGSLMFFTSDEGLQGATKGKELYEFNSTSHPIGAASPMSVHAVSVGLKGDQTPMTTVSAEVANMSNTVYVASTAGFHSGETIAFESFEVAERHLHDGGLVLIIASVHGSTELITTSPVHNTGGIPAGTEVHGVHPASVTAVSNDGSYVYFISNGVLAANTNADGAAAMSVKPNLYVFDTATDETTFIGTVAESDVQTAGGNPTGLAGEPDISRPAVPTPDGGVLAFASAANLTGQNPWQEYTEIYRYTVTGNKLECLSCTAPGVKPTGNANFGETAGGTYDPPGLTSPISEDGSRVFFDTPDSLVPEDTNGSAPQSAKFGTPTSTDVYEAEAGKVFLLSSGKATTPTVLQGTTPSGDDVLFTTTAKLAPQDTDGGYENVWDARVGGGFPAEAGGGKPTCVGTSCRAAFGVAPVFAPPASTTPQSAGSPPVSTRGVRAKPPVCRKGLVKKRVKGKIVCAKKSARKAGHTAGKTGRAARAGRAVANNVHRSR